MKIDIWMPLYIGDYLADTSRLTTEQHGAYLLLIMDYWRSGRPPDNDQVLAQICKLSPDAWCNAKAMLKQYFSIEDGFWVHKRIEAEILDAAQNQDRKHQRAVKGAAARWNKTNNDASSNAQATPMQCPSPSPSPSPLPLSLSKPIKDNYGSPEGVSPEVCQDFVKQKPTPLSSLKIKEAPDGVSPETWSDFLLLRKEKRSPVTETVIKGIRKEADKVCLSLQEAIEHCCVSGWQSFKAEWYENNKTKKQSAIYEAPWQKANRLRVAELTPRIARKDPNEKYVSDIEFFSNLKEIGNGTSN